MITLVGHSDSSSVGLFSSVCARSVCVYHVHRICSLMLFSFFVPMCNAPLSKARSCDGRWEIWEKEGHGPVVGVVVGEIDYFFQLLMLDQFLVRVLLISSTMLPEVFVLFVLPYQYYLQMKLAQSRFEMHAVRMRCFFADANLAV
jgi:hypothetical protein